MTELVQLSAVSFDPSVLTPPLTFAQAGPVVEFFNNLTGELGGFLPNLLGAIAVLLGGWFLAILAATAVKKILHSTTWDNKTLPILGVGRAGSD